MKIVEFYRGERPNHVEVYGFEMMWFSHFTMEVDHDWIQWAFPSNEPSNHNDEAPVLTKEECEYFKHDPKLQKRVIQFFEKILDFWGFQLKTDPIEVVDIEPTLDRMSPRGWLEYFNHNMLRATRVLKSLRLLGLEEYAKAFYTALERSKPKIGENTWKYWEQATFGDLWEA